MAKQIQFSYRGMNQDLAKSKRTLEYYFAANNIRILATDSQSTGSVTNEAGNSLTITIPRPEIDIVANTIKYNAKTLTYRQTNDTPEIEAQYAAGLIKPKSGVQKIIAHTLSRNGIILFTTDNKGFDCIWEIDNILNDDYSIVLLYCRNLSFSTSFPIQAIFNYENEKIQKVYWIGGKNQLRSLNTRHSIQNGDVEELIDINSNTINIVGNFKLSQPYITSVSTGGSHTSGKIQYAYNLYRINSSQTKISPLSEMVALGKGDSGGGNVNEIVGASPVISIDNLDPEYTHIRLYAVKYTSYNQLPSVSLLADERINSSLKFSHYDDGTVIKDISIEEFTFLGSDPISPKHIESKDNILFSANIEEINFDIDLDCRAYSHKAGGGGIVYDNIMQSPTNPDKIIGEAYHFTDNSYPNITTSNSTVNLDYNTYKFQADGITLGGEGKYLKFSLAQTPLTKSQAKDKEFFKDNEIYRIGVHFYNKLGQLTPVKWICDFRAPQGNLLGNYNTLKVELKPEFYQWLNTTAFASDIDKPIGYKIVRADRTVSDRSIICQGTLTGMMTKTVKNPKSYKFWKIIDHRRVASDELLKFPVPISRGFLNNLNPIAATDHLRMMNEEDQNPYPNTSDKHKNIEIYSSTEESSKRQQSWQYTKMFQMNSPEILFGEGLSFGAGLKLSIVGLVKNNKTNLQYKRIQVPSKRETIDITNENTNNLMIDRNVSYYGFFGPSAEKDEMDYTLISREYNTFLPTVNKVSRDILGAPEITERGQGPKSYNGRGELNYANNMLSFMTDRADDSKDGRWEAITSMNSFGNKTLTIVEGLDNIKISERKSLEDLYSLSGITDGDGLLLAEVRIPEKNLYLGNLYGGNSYEDKKRNTYLEIGSYNGIYTSTVEILSPGDTFVSLYKFARISKTDTEVLDGTTLQLTEIVSFPIETSIDLKNRNDKSLFDWNSEFQPRYDDFHKYNKVYSQQPTLIQNISSDAEFKRINNFDTRIMASKVKVPGEQIDSWTDFLINEVQDLDGKYGPINGLVNFNDNIFALQDSGVAAISINPRVQVQGSDGIGLELGRGSVLYDYNYLTTKSGTLNKWSIISTNSGFYYYDVLNKSWNRFTQGQIQGLSDRYGFHSFFTNNVNYNEVKADNPITRKGISTGYNSITNDVFLTVLQGSNSFTICFNEMTDSFTSFYDYKPSMYINKGSKMITLDNDNTSLWEHFKGNYGEFYGRKHAAAITILANPPEKDCVFNNIEFKSEMTVDGRDFPTMTIDQIRAYNEYQQSLTTPLILNKNLNRKFRMWRANIPRAHTPDGKPTLDRMRGQWLYIELKLSVQGTAKLTLHDITLSYNAYN